MMKCKTFLQLFILSFGGLCLVTSAINLLLSVTDGIWLQMALSLLGMSFGLATAVFAFEI